MRAAPHEEPEVAYFRDIERAFVERRGDPLFISNADWVFLARLRKKGVPVRVVLRGITDAFDAHAHSFARKRKIRSLTFCETEIMAAAERYRRSQQADGPSRRDQAAAVAALEARLDLPSAPPAIAKAVEEAREKVLSVSRSLEEDRDFEAQPALSRIEERLAEAAAAAMEPNELRDLETAARAITAAYESRMPPKVYESLIAESVRRRILQRFGLPRFLLADFE